MTKETDNSASDRVGIIQAVRTPLGFFTLVVLVVEIVLGISANLSQGADRSNLIIGMLALIFVLVALVAGLAVFRPEALRGGRPPEGIVGFEKLTAAQKIARYRALIEQETRDNLLLNFNVPAGYKPEISTIDKFTFGFCYPQDWVFAKFAQQVQYGAAIDVTSAREIGFARNLNLVISDMSQTTADLNDMYEGNLQQGLSLIPKAKVIFKDKNFIFQGLLALRVRIDWTPQTDEKQVLSLYQIQVADGKKANLYTLSFTTRREDFDDARPIFDNVANTFRV